MAGGDRIVDFENDVAPVLSRFSCNTSACHGKAEGQNGFKLSIFGNDPRADFEALTQASRSRRVMTSAPEMSLVLRKATGEIPHEGGARLTKGSDAYRLLADWISGGARWSDKNRPALTALTLVPDHRVMKFRSKQRLEVTAEFADGSTRDVTGLAVFHSNHAGIAGVSPDGVVTANSSTGQTAIMARYQGRVAVFRALVPRPDAAHENDPGPASPLRPVHNRIDELVDVNLRRLNLQTSPLGKDSDFLRRVHLDLAGRLPTAEEARKFLADEDPDKRTRLVDVLLDSPAHADFWALKWADLLRVDRQKLGRRDAFAYYSWLRKSVASNLPLDDFARTFLLAEGPLDESPAGHLYRVNKSPGETASTVAQVFLGVRISCAECHQHPYDRWTQQDYHGMRAFFEQVTTKTYHGNRQALVVTGGKMVTHPRSKKVVHPHPLGTAMPTEFSYEGGADRRRILAEWMTDPGNPWFSRNMANRIWAHLLGRGLVEPVDDVRATNPPSNPELLDLLASHLVDHDYDARALIRFITASRTYQLSSQTNPANEMDELNFARALFRRLPAEVLLDAVCDVTGVPEKFAGVPAGHRAVQLWDSQTRHYFLKLFGRPLRTTPCECERASGASISQALHLMNAPQLQAKLSHKNGRVARLLEEHSDDDALVEELYLTVFSRFPTDTERANAVAYFRGRPDRRQQAAEDLVWSMLNSLEFVFNH